MKIIIVGNGKVGYAIARQLAVEDHDITIVDDDAAALHRADSTLDVMCVEGNGASISVLDAAGVRGADLVIAAVHKLGMEGYFVLASTWYDFLRDNKNVLEDFMWHADEAETSMALSLYGDLVHMDLAIDGGGTPLVDPKWKMAPGEASHRWQFYGAEGTFALLEKDDLDYGVIGNPTKATKEKGDKLLVEAVVEGYSELIKELLETHPVGKNPLGFRNPLGYNGFNGGAYPTFDKDHDEKGRPTYYKK